MGWNRQRIEGRHECNSVHASQPLAGAGTDFGAPVVGGMVHVYGCFDWNPAWDSHCAPDAVQQAGSRWCEHHPDDSEPRVVWVSVTGAVAGRTSGPASHSGVDAICATADYPEYLRRHSWGGFSGA